MNVDCIPFSALPHVNPLFQDYVASFIGPEPSSVDAFYSPLCRNDAWSQHPASLNADHRRTLVELLRQQNVLPEQSHGTDTPIAANLNRLAAGAAAVVTGQQVGLFGGPLLTLLKAATAIHTAEQASRAGQPHVPIFWLASEDHDFEEISRATFFSGPELTAHLETLHLPPMPENTGRPVGDLVLGPGIQPLVEQMQAFLGYSEAASLLASTYTPKATFASAFAAFLRQVFASHGLIVIDAASRPFHALAASTLRAAVEHADDLHAALLERNRQLQQAGYAAQVMVGQSSSLLFLLDSETGARTALKKTPGGAWSAGLRKYSSEELLDILDAAPERLSPNALLRPVFQDTLLPVSAYIGGPAEIAYFAQSQVLYQQILGRTTPVLPRCSATIVDSRLGQLLHRHGLTVTDTFTTPEALAQRLGARAMPVEGKQKLAAAGNALDAELRPLLEWMHAVDTGLGHAGDVAASKMLYQMNRLRRLAARFSLEKDESLRRHAEILCEHLFPTGNLQERVLAGAELLARYEFSLVSTLVQHAQPGLHGHQALFL